MHNPWEQEPPNAHVIEWLWRDGVPPVIPVAADGMQAHKLQFIEKDPWYCALGVYKAWRATKPIEVRPYAMRLPVPF